jgi:NAD(P)H-hydrate epimerase
VTRIAVVTADGARELDRQTIATLPDSYTLMHRAATAAAECLHARDERSAAVYVGTGNNGGDGWLIAGMLRELGWSVTVHATEAPKTRDAQRAKADAERGGAFASPTGTEALILDAILGTGAAGAPRDAAADAIRLIAQRRSDAPVPAFPAPPRESAQFESRRTTPQRTVVAIDITSGLDATTGEDRGAVPADLTVTFGSVKRGQLLRRDLTGALLLLDIGLVDADAATPRLVTSSDVSAWLPTLPPDAYKGTRGRVAIVGGAEGMAGAVILAARGAHASGAGMVRADVAAASMLALQIAAPFATVQAWRGTDWSGIDTAWPDAMVIGPGLDGVASHIRDRVLALLYAYAGPVVLDAGALTAFGASPRIDDGEGNDDGERDPLLSLRHALRGRQALLTPHVGEFRALRGTVAPIARFDDATALARALEATVLLKGVPTVVASPDGTRYVSATGTPALAMGGTGDLLSGIAATLLAQGLSAPHAGAAAAWVHGTAAERATRAHGGWRGVTTDLLLHEVTNVWPALDAPPSLPPHTVLALPAVPTR